jgi:hypothetical protein
MHNLIYRSIFCHTITSLTLCTISYTQELEGNRKFETVLKKFLSEGLVVVVGHAALAAVAGGGRLLRASEAKPSHNVDYLIR